MFNPLAEEDNQEAPRSFSFYSDPLAGFAPSINPRQGGRGQGSGRHPAPPAAGGFEEPPPSYGMHQGPGMHHQSFNAPAQSHQPHSWNQGGRGGSFRGRGRGNAPSHQGWQAPQGAPPPMQQWEPQPEAKLQRTGPDTRFNRTTEQQQQPPQSFPRNAPQQQQQQSNFNRNSQQQQPMAKFYKPSFSQDPWRALAAAAPAQSAPQHVQRGRQQEPQGGPAGGAGPAPQGAPRGGSLAELLEQSMESALQSS